MGEAGLVIDDDLAAAHAMFQAALLSSPSGRIAGGSDEISANIIAERDWDAGGYPRGQEQAVQSGANREPLRGNAPSRRNPSFSVT